MSNRRDNKLLALTGHVVFNGEPNLDELFDAGPITPTNLHYIRCHGPTPEILKTNDYTLSVTVTLNGPSTTWTLEQITDPKRFTPLRIPVTLACNGNRRKEFKMEERSAGFNFTASAVSTSYWKGILVRDLLVASGFNTDPVPEWFLNFEGADCPQDGPYATSIPLAYALDTANDVMIAFEQNDAELHPDHGFPLRLIVPGYVGGRMVKWLKRGRLSVWVSEKHNMSYYHIHDNRVLPSEIKSLVDRKANEYLNKEETACTVQPLQSVICKPKHGLELSFRPRETYRLQGFSCNGAGVKINKVEISLDLGNSWRTCTIAPRFEPRGDKHWCWIFWSLEVALAELSNGTEIAVRATDANTNPNKNTQPKKTDWTCTGLMNNSWYRVKVTVIGDGRIKFEHPVAPFTDKSGWMKATVDDYERPPATTKQFSTDEIREHGKESDEPWLVMDNFVYDLTQIIKVHPGGKDALYVYAGQVKDSVQAEAAGFFANIHSKRAYLMRNDWLIGRVGAHG